MGPGPTPALSTPWHAVGSTTLNASTHSVSGGTAFVEIASSAVRRSYQQLPRRRLRSHAAAAMLATLLIVAITFCIRQMLMQSSGSLGGADSTPAWLDSVT